MSRQDVPAWALRHLEANLPAGNPVVNAVVVRRRMVLANTRLGAVLVWRGLLGSIAHRFLEAPSQKTAFRCANCRETLQFYNLSIPSDVYCSICATKYHVDADGAVTDAAGRAVPFEFKPKEIYPFPPVLDVAERVRDRVPVADAPGADAEVPEGPAFRHKGYTLYARRADTKGGAHVLYFFAKSRPRAGTPAPLPDGYSVGTNARTGLPFLRKARKARADLRSPRRTTQQRVAAQPPRRRRQAARRRS